MSCDSRVSAEASPGAWRCARCGTGWKRHGGDYRRKYCSRKCREQDGLARVRAANPFLAGIPTATTGTVSELRVCVDLLSKGYEVFRAVSPSCSCDLAILRDGRLLRVEVKTCRLRIDGSQANGPIPHRADILARVYPSEIRYERNGLPVAL